MMIFNGLDYSAGFGVTLMWLDFVAWSFKYYIIVYEMVVVL